VSEVAHISTGESVVSGQLMVSPTLNCPLVCVLFSQFSSRL